MSATSHHQNKGDQIVPILVEWDENESTCPHNWSTKFKAWITFQLSMLAMAASLGSSIMAPAELTLEKRFQVSHEVVVLCISLYMYDFRLSFSSITPSGLTF